MKSIFILIFMSIIIWITYNYSYNKYYTDKIEKDIKFILLPQTIDYQFKYKQIDNMFMYIEPNNEVGFNTINNIDNKSNKKYSLQRYFTEF